MKCILTKNCLTCTKLDLTNTQKVRYNRAGQPFLKWDAMLFRWDPDWQSICLDSVTWNALLPAWIAFSTKSAGAVRGPPDIPARKVEPIIAQSPNFDFTLRRFWNRKQGCVHLFSDCLVLIRILQGQWKPKTVYSQQLTALVNQAFYGCVNLMMEGPEGWWCTHIERTLNGGLIKLL